MIKSRIASIIVSAGFSSRMDGFKPFLKFGGITAIEKVINTLKISGIEDIYVVVGHRGEEVIEKIKYSGVTCVMNENYPEGMFSSIKKGVAALDQSIDAFALMPVDIPLVKSYTIKLLKNEYIRGEKGIIYPVFSKQKGHPPIIDCKYREIILRSNGEGGLKRILEGFESDAQYVPVFDEAILKDMDTKEAYEELLSTFYLNAPNKKECYAILEHYKVPEHIRKHCEKVAEVAIIIQNSLKNYGYVFDEADLLAAAMLHDLVRQEKKHAELGATILTKMGFERIGQMIATHMDILVNESDRITEHEILYLADKLVKEDRIVPLVERFEKSIRANALEIEVLEKIKARYNSATSIIRKIEKVTGKGFIYG